MHYYETDPNIKIAKLSELGAHSAREFWKYSSYNRKFVAGIYGFTMLSVSDAAVDTLTELGESLNAGVGLVASTGFLLTHLVKVSARRQWQQTAADTIIIARQNSIEVPEWSLEGLPEDFKQQVLAS